MQFYLKYGTLIEYESSISFFFVHEESSHETKSIWPEIVASAVTAIFKKLALINLNNTTKN